MDKDIRKLEDITTSNRTHLGLTMMFTKPKYSPYLPTLTITYAPTNNCQLACAASIGLHFRELNKYHVRDLLINIRRNTGKPLLLVDIKSYYVDELLDKVAASCIISKTDYISSNNSSMTLIIINVRKVRQLGLPKN